MNCGNVFKHGDNDKVITPPLNVKYKKSRTRYMAPKNTFTLKSTETTKDGLSSSRFFCPIKSNLPALDQERQNQDRTGFQTHKGRTNTKKHT